MIKDATLWVRELYLPKGMPAYRVDKVKGGELASSGGGGP